MVYVSADSRPQKRDILVRDGKIAFVGDGARARRMAPGAARVDLAGSFVFPGWADAHGHLAGLGQSLEVADLRGAASAGEAARRIGAIAAGLPAGSWAQGRGWDQNRWPGEKFPDARDLDAVLPDRPVVARRVDGHAVWVNSAALKAASVGAATRDPEGGRIVRRADGSPSGVLVDRAVDLVQSVMPRASLADFERRIPGGGKGLREGRADRGAGRFRLRRRRRSRRSAKLADAGLLPIRVYATVSNEARGPARVLREGPAHRRGSDFLTVRAIKVLRRRRARQPRRRAACRLLGRVRAIAASSSLAGPPRRDRPRRPGSTAGSSGSTPSETAATAWRWTPSPRPRPLARRACRSQAPAHRARSGPRARRHPAIRQEGVIASVQPTHATSDMPWAQDARRARAHRGRLRVAEPEERRGAARRRQRLSRSNPRTRCSGSMPR